MQAIGLGVESLLDRGFLQTLTLVSAGSYRADIIHSMGHPT
jgi:hypothetical protein